MTTEMTHPYLVRRYASLILDQLFLIFLIMGISTLLINLGLMSNALKIVFIIFFFLYEPLLISINCTFGQWITKIRVRKMNPSNQKISFLSALLRFIVKIALGVISFFTIHSNKEKRAIHDMIANSVVIEAK